MTKNNNKAYGSPGGWGRTLEPAFKNKDAPAINNGDDDDDRVCVYPGMFDRHSPAVMLIRRY